MNVFDWAFGALLLIVLIMWRFNVFNDRYVSKGRSIRRFNEGWEYASRYIEEHHEGPWVAIELLDNHLFELAAYGGYHDFEKGIRSYVNDYRRKNIRK